MNDNEFSVLQLHEISETGHQILNPLTDAKLMLMGEVSRVGAGTRILDLACGKGELLSRWAQVFGCTGHGVDLSPVFLSAARTRAEELGVADRVSFEEGDAGAHVPEPASYDVGACIGATWIGGGLAGTVDLLLPAVRPDGVVLIGEPYWVDPPPPAVAETMGGPEEFVSLAGTVARLAAAGLEVVEMVLADGDSWDRYRAAQWWALDEWLRAHPEPGRRREQVREFLDGGRRDYLESGRRYLGWGVFVGRPLA